MESGQAINSSRPVTISRYLRDGDTLELAGKPWTVLHTPGHALGAICLYQPERQHLITADHLLPKINSNPVVEPPPPGQTKRPRSLVDYLRSLERIATLDVEIAFPGHGEPIKNHRELISRRIAHRQNRNHQLLEQLTGEGQTVYQLAQLVFRPEIPGDQLFLMVSEVLGQLELLEERGMAQMSEEGNVWLYRRQTQKGGV